MHLANICARYNFREIVQENLFISNNGYTIMRRAHANLFEKRRSMSCLQCKQSSRRRRICQDKIWM